MMWLRIALWATIFGVACPARAEEHGQVDHARPLADRGPIAGRAFQADPSRHSMRSLLDSGDGGSGPVKQGQGEASVPCSLVPTQVLYKKRAPERTTLVPLPQNVSESDLDCVSPCRKFKEKHSQVPAPILLSFPGSGNSWIRMLLEYVTEYYSGSIYRGDQSYNMWLRGEGQCNDRVLVVKAHPHKGRTWHTLRQGKVPPYCSRWRVQRAILVIRNPFDAIWSNYQRLVSLKLYSDAKNKKKSKSGSNEESASNINQHVTKILSSDFDPNDFREYALVRSRWWRRTIELCIAPALDELQDKGDAMLVKYEDLVRIESRTNTLLKMVEFLKVPARDGDLAAVYECAYSWSTKYQRSSVMSSGEKQLEYVTREHAYSVCNCSQAMWDNIEEIAPKYGYGPYMT